jgi:Domain of unknown function (DUF4402)
MPPDLTSQSITINLTHTIVFNYQIKSIMKNLIIIAMVVIGYAVDSFAQATASATATATIISGISIAKVTDLNYGNAAISITGLGTINMSPAGVRVAGGAMTLPVVTGTVSAATFTVTGAGTSTYSITLPSSHSITRVSGTESLGLSAFTSTPSGVGTLSAGTQNISVGALLAAGSGTVAGVYTNPAGFNVTVNYN